MDGTKVTNEGSLEKKVQKRQTWDDLRDRTGLAILNLLQVLLCCPLVSLFCCTARAQAVDAQVKTKGDPETTSSLFAGRLV